MLEEGTFAYNYFDYKYSFLKMLFMKVVFRENLFNKYVGGFVYKPEYMSIANDIDIHINKLPVLSEGNYDLKTVMNEVFQYNNEDNLMLLNSIIYFDQEYPFESINNQIEKIVFMLVEKFKHRDDFILKMHPQSNGDKYGSQMKVKNRVPYELICINSDVERSVLISVFSTACLNPKIMFDKEPYVILLYKLIDLTSMTNITSETYKIANEVKNSYTQKNKFFIPETLQELFEILEKINNIKL